MRENNGRGLDRGIVRLFYRHKENREFGGAMGLVGTEEQIREGGMMLLLYTKGTKRHEKDVFIILTLLNT